jgi:hypothetical protein
VLKMQKSINSSPIFLKLLKGNKSLSGQEQVNRNEFFKSLLKFKKKKECSELSLECKRFFVHGNYGQVKI